MTGHDTAVKIRKLVDRQVQAWEKHDFGIAAPDWLPCGELISPSGHVPAEEMQTVMADYFKQFRDLRVTVKNVFISTDGAKAAIEWDWDVTRRRDGARAQFWPFHQTFLRSLGRGFVWLL
jgi:SnoaL-like domain